MKSTYHGKAEVDLARFVVDEITLVGSRCGPFAPALALLASGRVDPRPLVEARYPLARGDRRLRARCATGNPEGAGRRLIDDPVPPPASATATQGVWGAEPPNFKEGEQQASPFLALAVIPP